MSVNMKQSGNLIQIASLTKAIIPLGVADCYSEEERQVGCWIDGKPLYQKAYEFSTVVSVSANTYVTIISNSGLNIDTLVNGFSKPSKESTFTPVSLNVSNDDIQAYYSTAWSIKYFVIQYTKTTDTAGSGIWTPSGTYAKHMSTTEQVVGTYLGETVYAKVIDNLNMTLNSSIWNNIANIAGAKDLVDLKMWGYFAEYYLINYSLAHIDSGGQGLLEIRVDSEANTRIVKRIYAEYTKTS